MSQADRDVLKVMTLVQQGLRTQAEAGRLLDLSVRQVRRIQRRLESQGDAAVIHQLRGRASNHALGPGLKGQVLAEYRRHYLGFGPTLACEKLLEGHELSVGKETLRQWLLDGGLWQRQRRRDRHRQRRQRRLCFGEMVQADASEHDWLEGRGERLVLAGMIDDATSRAWAWFYEAETTEAYMDLLWRWLRRHGRPLIWYSDKDSIFRAEDEHGQPVATQFSRALSELDIELILADSPQAKGRIERLWGTAQDRLVKELRLAGACTAPQSNAVLSRRFLPWFNRRCTVPPASVNDAHRELSAGGHELALASILSHQEVRTVANDYTIRLDNSFYQLLPPAWPGERGGRVVVEKRLDGSMHIRFKDRYLPYRKIQSSNNKDGMTHGKGKAKPEEQRILGEQPPSPRSLALAQTPADGAVGAVATAPAANAKGRGAAAATRPSAVRLATGCSGRTAAEPCPSDGTHGVSRPQPRRPAPNHPWRNYRQPKPKRTQADISIGPK